MLPTKAVSAALHWGSVAALGFSLGCPQLLDDQFSLQLPNAGSGGVSGQDGSGATGAPGGGGPSPDCDPRVLDRCVTDVDASLPDAQSTVPVCASGEQRGPNGRCYFSQATELTWQAARASCQARGAGWDLATVRSSEDNDFIRDLTGYEAWLGGSDAADEDVWLWVTDSAEFYDDATGQSDIYTNWSPDEPNDNNGSDCLRMLLTGFWADLECDSLKGKVCAKEAR